MQKRFHIVGNTQSLAGYLHERQRAARKTVLAGLMLTPMVDMFSLLVIFLLQFFNASPDFQLTNGIMLPISHSSDTIHEVPVVSLTAEELLVDHRMIGLFRDLIKKPEPLVQALEQVRDQWVAAHPGEDFAGEINLEAHQDLESTVIAEVMGILSSQHFGSIQLVALGE